MNTLDKLKSLLNEDQDEKAVEKTYSKLPELLTKDEEIQYMAVQKKPAVNLSPDSIVLTNKRIIFCRPKKMGLGMKFQDTLWKDVAYCQMSVGAPFSIKRMNGSSIYMEWIPKSQARLMYRITKEREEAISYRRELQLKKQELEPKNQN